MNQSRSNVVDLPLAQVKVLTVGQYTSSLSIVELSKLPRSLQFKERDRLETLIAALHEELDLDHGLHLTSLEHVQAIALARYKAVRQLLIAGAVS